MSQTVGKAELIELFISQDVLRFGEFTLKSGRVSPYFFNTGKIDNGAAIGLLGEAYADAIEAFEGPIDVLFGPAYKGIPVAVAAGVALARRGRNLGIAYNRKEVKAHGEGGRFVGADVQGRVLIVEDVLTAGTAVREAVAMIQAAGGQVVGVIIALDRQERMEDGQTAVQSLARELAAPVRSLLCLQDVIAYLDSAQGANKYQPSLIRQVHDYQAQYCVV